jgi:hypothetical protein
LVFVLATQSTLPLEPHTFHFWFVFQTGSSCLCRLCSWNYRCESLHPAFSSVLGFNIMKKRCANKLMFIFVCILLILPSSFIIWIFKFQQNISEYFLSENSMPLLLRYHTEIFPLRWGLKNFLLLGMAWTHSHPYLILLNSLEW